MNQNELLTVKDGKNWPIAHPFCSKIFFRLARQNKGICTALLQNGLFFMVF